MRLASGRREGVDERRGLSAGVGRRISWVDVGNGILELKEYGRSKEEAEGRVILGPMLTVSPEYVGVKLEVVRPMGENVSVDSALICEEREDLRIVRCFLQYKLFETAEVGHPLTRQGCPPPWDAQNLDFPRATFLQSSIAQVFPPPCLTQK